MTNHDLQMHSRRYRRAELAEYAGIALCSAACFAVPSHAIRNNPEQLRDSPTAAHAEGIGTESAMFRGALVCSWRGARSEAGGEPDPRVSSSLEYEGVSTE